MDYLKLPRELIYKDRNNLKDFEVGNHNSINYWLFSELKKMPLMRTEGALDTALRCFNNAYYICTLIQLEDFPELRIADYEKKLLNEKGPYVDDVCSTSMAMVCLLLQAYDERYRQKDNDLISAITDRFTHYRWIHTDYCLRFLNMVGRISPITFQLNQDEFNPRDIIDAIDNVNLVVLEAGAEYICERLTLLDNPRKRMYGADMAIARMNDYLREMKESLNGNIPSDMEFFNDCKISSYSAAIEYIKEHYPVVEEIDFQEQSTDSPHESETEDLQAKIKELESKLTRQNTQLQEANKTNEKLTTQIEELETQVRELSVETPDAINLKLRIEVLNIIMRAAGYDVDVITKKRLVSSLIILYRYVLGKGANSLLRPCIGKVTYQNKPDGLDNQIAEINKTLNKINSDWKINL